MMQPIWIEWAQQLQAIAQTGLAFTPADSYDGERYEQIMAIAAQITAVSANLPLTQINHLWQAENGYATPHASRNYKSSILTLV